MSLDDHLTLFVESVNAVTRTVSPIPRTAERALRVIVTSERDGVAGVAGAGVGVVVIVAVVAPVPTRPVPAQTKHRSPGFASLPCAVPPTHVPDVQIVPSPTHVVQILVFVAGCDGAGVGVVGAGAGAGAGVTATLPVPSHGLHLTPPTP